MTDKIGATIDAAKERIQGATEPNMKFGDVELPPIRHQNDFLLQARFQMPPYNDLEKWNNRLCANLLYYQTNYLLIILAVFTLVGVLHPREILTGAVCILGCVAVLVYAVSTNNDALTFKREHPVFTLVGMLLIMYLLVYTMSSVIVFLYGLALPLFLVLVHASLRLRNVENKLTSTMNKLTINKTAMGRLFDAIGVNPSAI